MIDVLPSEWLKLRSVRSTHYAVAATAAAVLLAVALAWAWGSAWDGAPPERRASFSTGSVEQTLTPVLQLCMGVLGVLSITGEFATGLIRTSITVVPRRRRLLVAKAAVLAATTVAIGLVSVVAIHLVSVAVLNGRAIPGYTASFAEELPGLLCLGLSVAVVALVGLGLGVVMRSTAAAIGVLAALLFVLPMLARLAPEPWNERLSSVLLPSLADQLSLAGAAIAMATYVAIAIGMAMVLIGRRDV